MNPDYSTMIAALYPILLKCASRFCKDEEEAADLRGETVLRVLEHIKQYDPEKSSLLTYCIAIMRNIFIDEYNRRKAAAEIPGQYHEPPGDDVEGNVQCNFIMPYLNKDTLLSVQGYTYQEIATMQNLRSKATIHARIHMCVNQLRAILGVKRAKAVRSSLHIKTPTRRTNTRRAGN